MALSPIGEYALGSAVARVSTSTLPPEAPSSVVFTVNSGSTMVEVTAST
jgi:hypothetical protein